MVALRQHVLSAQGLEFRHDKPYEAANDSVDDDGDGVREKVQQRHRRLSIYPRQRHIRFTAGSMSERALAHLYETGGMRRTHLRGRKNVLKRLLVHVGFFNLSLVLRKQLGAGTPRGLAAAKKALQRLEKRLRRPLTPLGRSWDCFRSTLRPAALQLDLLSFFARAN